MDVRTWQEIEAVFVDALGREESERMPWLRTRCADQPDILAEVEGMLAAHTRPMRVEPLLVDVEGAPEEDDPLRGTMVGPFRLLTLLGRGGMGTVWLAEQTDGTLDRQVAVKLVRRPHTLDEARMLRRRFEVERRILARLQHPGIVRLLEAGTSDGHPYFAMDYVAGRPITTYCKTTADATRLRLFLQVCDAVHHAHRHLIVHRDLKPSNILVTGEGDAKAGEVKLLDFGIARLLDDDTDRQTTDIGHRPLTRAYAAPEQLRGEPATTATDVYSLGVVLHELLTGGLPAKHRRLRGDLDAIVRKALSENPEARFASADAFAADIRRYLDGQPVLARAPSLGYRARVFVRRHRTGVAAAVAAIVALAAFTAALAVQQRATVIERDTAEATAAFLEEILGAADPLAMERRDTLRIADLLHVGLERARTDLADAPLVRARLLHVIGRSFISMGSHAEAVAPLTDAVALLRVADEPDRLASSLTELAGAYRAVWQLDEAEALVREALAMIEARRMESAPRNRAEQVLAMTLLNAGRADEAEAVLRASLARQAEGPADALPTMLSTRQNLAFALLDQGRMDEAEAELLAIRDAYPDGDVRALGALRPLTFLYLASGRLDEADRAGEAAVALEREARPGSATLGQLLTTHAATQRRRGRYDEATALLHEALALPVMRVGERAIAFGTLASILADQGDRAGAIEAQRKAVAALKADSTFPPEAVAASEAKLEGYR